MEFTKSLRLKTGLSFANTRQFLENTYAMGIRQRLGLRFSISCASSSPCFVDNSLLLFVFSVVSFVSIVSIDVRMGGNLDISLIGGFLISFGLLLLFSFGLSIAAVGVLTLLVSIFLLKICLDENGVGGRFTFCAGGDGGFNCTGGFASCLGFSLGFVFP